MLLAKLWMNCLSWVGDNCPACSNNCVNTTSSIAKTQPLLHHNKLFSVSNTQPNDFILMTPENVVNLSLEYIIFKRSSMQSKKNML